MRWYSGSPEKHNAKTRQQCPKEKPEKTKPAQPSQEKKGKQRKARIKVLTAGKGTS